MPAKTERRHRQGQESRQRILEAALEIAAERGYDGTTVALITEKTGLPASSVYWQFKNKDVLLAEALEYSYRDWRRNGPTWQPSNYSGDGRDRIMNRMRHARESIEKQPEYWRLGLMVAMLRKSSKIAAQEKFLAARRETLMIIDEWWQSALPEQAAASAELTTLLTQAHLAFVDGMFVAHRAVPDIDLDRLVEVFGEAVADVAEAWSADVPATLARLAAARRATNRLKPTSPGPVAEDSRARLLAAAADIAAERGYRGTTISRICERANLPVSSVYWFFTDKDELLAQVVQLSWDAWAASQPEWRPPKPDESRADALRHILRRAVRSLPDAPAFLRIGHMLALEQQATEVAARQAFLEIRLGIQARISEWFAAEIPASTLTRNPDLPGILANGLIAYTDGYFLGFQIDGAERDAGTFAEFVVDVLEAVVTRNS